MFRSRRARVRRVRLFSVAARFFALASLSVLPRGWAELSSFDHNEQALYRPTPFSLPPPVFFPLPKLPPFSSIEPLQHVTYKTGPNETLEKVLLNVGVSQRDAQGWLRSVRTRYPALARRLPQGRELHFYFSPGEQGAAGKDARKLKALELEVQEDRFLAWERSTRGIVFSRRDRPHEVEVHAASGVVETGFAEDGIRAGLNSALLSQLVDIFSWDIDFQKDLRQGDTFKLIYERRYPKGKEEKASFRILAADVTSGDQKYSAIYFEKERGKGKYYDLDGRSLARAFLRFPLEFINISSFFTHSRFHPILKTDRPHYGVDFAAKRGTPVRSIGDGKVFFAGWRKGGFGRLVEIQHSGNDGSVYTSRYAHLQAVAKGVRKGVSVKKGQVIGFVGSTGRSTGPHLHFELYKDETYVDPLKVDLPPEDELAPVFRRAFNRVKQLLLTETEPLPSS